MAAIPVHIDQRRCTGCGLCTTVCPDNAISLQQGKALPTGRRCLSCGHCLAVCPVKAIHVEGIITDPAYQSFLPDNRWLPFGDGDLVQLVRLMRSRRSCRRYQPRHVPKEILEDLVAIATTAPSGTNSQGWMFTILPERAAVEKLGTRVAACFRRLNRLAANPLLRTLLKLLGRPALANYHQRYAGTIAQGLAEWEETGRDRLFHGAPAAIIIGSTPDASCPKEDALLATQNLLLAAHAMGLGSCLIGFAVAAMTRDPSIQTTVAIPAEETIHAVIALGYPDIAFQRLTGRRPTAPRYAPS